MNAPGARTASNTVGRFGDGDQGLRLPLYGDLSIYPLCVRGLAAKTPVSKTGRRRFESCRACKYPTIERWPVSEVATTVAVSSMASCCDG